MKSFFHRIESKALNVAERSVTIVAFGDSVTQGVMEHRQLDPAKVYHRLLLERLEFFFPTTSFNMINSGVAGGSASQALERLERDVLCYAPDLVLVAFGLNDSLGGSQGLPAFGAALRAITAKVQNETRADLVLLTPPMIARRDSLRIHPEHEVCAERIIEAQTSGALAAYAEEIRVVADESEVMLIDIYAEWERLNRQGLDTDLWITNGLNHPDARGHRLAAELIFAHLLAHRP
jgi:acyl-CoA thioesterase-1